MFMEFTQEQPVDTRPRLGNYKITGFLGKGGFAQVYLGEHIYLKTHAAIKVLNSELANEVDKRAFHAEARLLAGLRHPHIVRVLDFGVKEGRPFLAMEYASHGTLRQHFPVGVSVPLNEVVPCVLQIANALQYVHNRKLIHCDVKPGNILLGPRNEVWLSDFGIARSTQCEYRQNQYSLQGTVAYAAPEQYFGKLVPASDQYALAVMVYEWLCGHLPFQGSDQHICDQHLYSQPISLREMLPSLAPAIDRVILKALAKNPQKRFSNILDFARTLKQASLEECTPRRACAIRTASPLRCQRRMPQSVEMPPLEPVRQPVSVENAVTQLCV